MNKIAILDTGIDEKQLQCGKFQSYDICKQGCKSQSGFAHGTICARILEQFTSDYELIPASNEPSAVLARAFGECREGHIPRCLQRGC